MSYARILRRCALGGLMAAVLGCLTMGASQASAGAFGGGTYYVGGPWAVGTAPSPWYLSQVRGVSGSGGPGLCINALDVMGGTLAGAGSCWPAGGQWLYHDYCSCVWRQGVAYAYNGTATIWGDQDPT